ncbi:hypothetical protein BGZ75_004918 [Mortierella antarctica]|nr:hypothetical protein BGZ75_004918 [Mortierella antarctica]
MGLEGLYWWPRKKKCYNPILRLPKHSPLPDGATIRVHVLSFFHKIRWIYTRHTDDKIIAHAVLLAHINKFGDPSRMVYYVEGYPALEKQDTHRIREERTIETIKTAEAAIENLNERVQQARLPTKELFKNVNKNLQLRYLGIATNYKVIKGLQDAVVPSLVQEYLESPIVIWRDQDDIDFTAPILVFTTMAQEIAVPVGTASDPPSTAQSELPLMDHATLPMSFQVICKEYESIKEQHAMIKAQRRMTSSGKSRAINFSSCDRQTSASTWRLVAGSSTPIFAQGTIRTATATITAIYRQYQWKPYTAEQEVWSKKVIAETTRRQAEKEQLREARRRKKEKGRLKKPPGLQTV